MSLNLTIDGNGYNNAMNRHRYFKSLVAALAKTLPHIMREYKATHIAVQGKSGIAVAFAMAAQSKTPIGIIVVRKAGESTHGNKIESDGRPIKNYIFFDDFVDSGATRDRVRHALNIRADVTAAVRPECVATVLWGLTSSSTCVGELSPVDYAYSHGLITPSHYDYLVGEK